MCSCGLGGGGGKRGLQNELLFVSLGVFSSLIKFVDVAINGFSKPGSDEFRFLSTAWSASSTGLSAQQVVDKWLLSVHPSTHSFDKFLLRVWLWADNRVLGIWWQTRWTCPCPYGASILIVEFTVNYSSIKCHEEEWTSFSGNEQPNQESRLKRSVPSEHAKSKGNKQKKWWIFWSTW